MSSTHPPKLAQRLLRFFLRDDLSEEVFGDLEEEFAKNLRSKSKLKACIIYWFEVLNYLRPFAIRKANATSLNPYYMIFSTLKITVRSMRKYKLYSAINLFGLTIGLLAFLALSLYIVDEFSYDRFHKQGDRIFRTIATVEFDGRTEKWAAAPNKLAPIAINEIPEIERAARLFHHNFGDMAFLLTKDDAFSENKLFYADKELLEIFSFNFIRGDQKTALEDKGSIILSTSAAIKYFGTLDCLEKTLTIDNQSTYLVKGVYQDFPQNSTLQCSLIASLSSIPFGQDRYYSWGNVSFETYFLTRGSNRDIINEKLEALLSRNIAHENRWYKISLQALHNIHLHSDDLKATSAQKMGASFSQLKILLSMALVVLILAAINYSNLATAQAQRRHKEVGISKTMGASFLQLARNFFVETSLFTLVAIILCNIIFILLLPQYNLLTGKAFTISYLMQPTFWALGLGTWAILTLLAGAYPSLYLSSLSPKNSLTKHSKGYGQSIIRKGLVVVQFCITTVMIVSAVIFYSQMEFIRSKNLGYQPDQVIAIFVTAASGKQLETVKTELEKTAGVQQAALCQAYPGVGTSAYTIRRNQDDDTGMLIQTSLSSPEVLDVLGIKLLAGRYLPENNQEADTPGQVILNRAAIDYLSLQPEEAIGKRVTIFDEGESEILGVVENFHFASFHQQISPFAFHNVPNSKFKFLLIKLNGSNMSKTISDLERKYKSLVNSSFDYSFIDQQMARLHYHEENLSKTVTLFTLLSILIACSGLYGLAAYIAAQKAKEICIRKVFGASDFQIIKGLSIEFMNLILIAISIGIPISIWFKGRWLENFAYQIPVSFNVYFFSVITTLLLASIATSYEAIKATRRNVSENLRKEQ